MLKKIMHDQLTRDPLNIRTPENKEIIPENKETIKLPNNDEKKKRGRRQQEDTRDLCSKLRWIMENTSYTGLQQATMLDVKYASIGNYKKIIRTDPDKYPADPTAHEIIEAWLEKNPQEKQTAKKEEKTDTYNERRSEWKRIQRERKEQRHKNREEVQEKQTETKQDAPIPLQLKAKTVTLELDEINQETVAQTLSFLSRFTQTDDTYNLKMKIEKISGR